MEYKIYASSQKELYNSLITFIESDDQINNENLFQEITKIIQKQKILEELDDSKIFLQLISTISANHHRVPNFFDKIIQIIKYIIENISQSITNAELYSIFQHDKQLLFYLFKTKLIQADGTIANTIVQKSANSSSNYLHFFFPQIKNFLELRLVQKIESKLFEKGTYTLADFERKCQIGENESLLCELIRNDDIDEFVPYVTMKCLSLSSKINTSLFETNSFLLCNEPTLIEYSAFFGSIQIFNFLRMNSVEFDGSLWLYAIHGNNAEIIHLLEQISLKPKDETYKECFEEAIKCHHNGIADYIYNYLINGVDDGFEKNCLSLYFNYFNFYFFPDEYDNQFIIYCACQYNYFTLFKNLLKDKRYYTNTKKANKKAFVRIKIKYFLSHFKYILSSFI